VLKSGSIRAILAVAAVATAVSAGMAAPATAAPAAPVSQTSSVAGPGLYGFGSNYYGELGDGTTTGSLSPVLVTGLPGTVKQVAAGFQMSGAVMPDGTVWTWGDDAYGQLGYPPASSIVAAPQQVPGLSGITNAPDHAPLAAGRGHAAGRTRSPS
jgi:hypothetical protein